MPPDDILRAVALATSLPASAIQGRDRAHDLSRARHLWVYLMVQFLPQAGHHPARAGKTRRACDQDGNVKPVARLLGWAPSNVRYAVHRIEDLRDDPAFDSLVGRIEGVLRAA